MMQNDTMIPNLQFHSISHISDNFSEKNDDPPELGAPHFQKKRAKLEVHWEDGELSEGMSS